MRVALRRAAHQLFDNPPVLDDPIALRIVGEEAAAHLRAESRTHRGRIARSVRAFMAVRSRLAEDELARALGRGVTQYVILGAGLDTFAYRNPHAGAALRIFEVDFPATQSWKRRKLAAAGIPLPAALSFVPVNFEVDSLAERLNAAGFDPAQPTFFTWLGVTMYLTDAALTSTLGFVAATREGGGLVFDYAVPRASLGWLERIAFDSLSRRVAAAGEPFRTFFDPAVLNVTLGRLGFHTVVDVGRDELNARYFAGRHDRLRVRGGLGRLVSAQIGASRLSSRLISTSC
jgi:methyltransferase (TIGR00027 family)